MVNNLLREHPELNNNPHFLRRYASMLAQSLRFDEAINILSRIIEEDNVKGTLPQEIRVDMLMNIADYKRYKLLATFQTPK